MPRALFQFEDFELDCARFELRRKGRPLRLEKIPMELLQLLVESDGRLVTREEIEERPFGTRIGAPLGDAVLRLGPLGHATHGLATTLALSSTP